MGSAAAKPIIDGVAKRDSKIPGRDEQDHAKQGAMANGNEEWFNCKNGKRWTQRTKMREKNAENGSVKQMTMREPIESKSENAIICSWSRIRNEVRTSRNEGDEQDCLAKRIKTKKQDATDEERSPQRRGRW
jgi:hypothetical protein